MDRYACYLNSCRLERRRPLGENYFRLRYEDLLRAEDAPEDLPLHIDWNADIPKSEEDIVGALVMETHPLPVDRTSVGQVLFSFVHQLSKTLLAAGTGAETQRFTPPDDRPEFGGSGPKNEPPDAAPGVREPLRPHSPLLSGSAARAYPPTEPPRWWAV